MWSCPISPSQTTMLCIDSIASRSFLALKRDTRAYVRFVKRGFNPNCMSRNLLKKALLVVLGTGGGLLVCELAASAYVWFEERSWHRVQVAPPRKATDSVFTILSAGESSLLGEPYHTRFNIPMLVRSNLQRAFPERQFALEFRAGRGRDLHQLFPSIMEHLRSKPPGLFILMFGHNDFLSNYGINGECDEGKEAFFALASKSALFRLFYERRQRLLVAERPQAGLRKMLDKPLLCGSMHELTLRRYRSELEAIARLVERAKVPSVFIFPASNEASFDPNRSVYRGVVSKEERFQTIMRCGVHYNALQRWNSLLACMNTGRTIDPSFSLLNYFRGKALRQLGDTDGARVAFKTAKDQDGHPWRALTAQRDIMAEVARAHGILFIDAASLLEEGAASGLLDESLFHDIHHPSLKGYNAIAQEVARRISIAEIVGMPRTEVQPPSENDIVTTFQFSRSDLFDVFISRVEWLARVTDVSFDPGERLQLLVRNLDAAEAIDSRRAQRVLGESRIRDWRRRAADNRRASELIPDQPCIATCGIRDETIALDDKMTTTAAPPLLDLYPYMSAVDSHVLRIQDLASSSLIVLKTSRQGLDLNNNPLKVRNQPAPDGFIAHPFQKYPSEVVFDLPTGYSRLHGAVAIADSGSSKSSVRCQIETDGSVVFSSPVLRLSDAPLDFSVSLVGAKQLRLVCDDAGDGPDFDHVTWFRLRLDRADNLGRANN
jgi:hypothetical protein